MQGLRSDIVVVGDGSSSPRNVLSALWGSFNCRHEDLSKYPPNGDADAYLYVFCANAGSDDVFARLKKAVKVANAETLIVLPTYNDKSIRRIKDLGISSYLVQPLDQDELRRFAKQAVNRQVERSWAALDQASQAALKASLAAFEDCFARVQRGEPLPMEEVEQSCRMVRESAKMGTFGAWVDALDSHHNYSFRHSMFVCGSLTYFANAIGIGGSDLQLLTVGGLLHDVGKSRVPLEILDKPGKLDADEWDIMRKHPVHSREILLREQSLDPNAIAMAVHHHEKLDGTGYPDGLSGTQINDHMRLTAIADVFSALIDKRSYKEAMTKEAALDLMGKFEGHLDMDLLRTFRSFVLDS